MVDGGVAPTGPVQRIPEPMLLPSSKAVHERRNLAYRINVVTQQIEMMKVPNYYPLPVTIIEIYSAFCAALAAKYGFFYDS